MTEGPRYPDQPYGPPPPYDPTGPGGNDPVAPRRPGTVVTACVLTWVFSGMTILLAGIMLIGAAGSTEEVREQLREDPRFDDLGVDPEQMLTAMSALSAVALVLSVVAVVAAVLAFRGSNTGRILLAACAGLAAVISLVTVLACVPLVTLIASVATAILLFTGGANEWYRSRRA